MTSAPELERIVSDLLRRAALFRAAALGFAYPAPGHATQVREALGRATAWDDGRPPGPSLTQALATAREAWSAALEPELREEYARLFLGNPPCPLHETAYGDGRRIAGRPVELADIGGFYAAFGMELSDASPDLPDHLCSELEFYSVLLVKLAYARSQGWTGRCQVTESAARSFLDCHLGRWTGAFAAGLEEHAASAPYRDLAHFLKLLIAHECERLDVRPALALGRLPSDEMQEERLVCPRAGRTPQAE